MSFIWGFIIGVIVTVLVIATLCALYARAGYERAGGTD